MKNKTAVEWLIENYFGSLENCTPNFRNKIIEAKAIEREQIINAYDAGTFYLEGGLYYKETFENESGI